MRRIQMLTPVALVLLTIAFVALGLPGGLDAGHFDARIVWSTALGCALACGAWLRQPLRVSATDGAGGPTSRG